MTTSELPLILAGPWLRHTHTEGATLMFVTSRPLASKAGVRLWSLQASDSSRPVDTMALFSSDRVSTQHLPLGEHCFLYCVCIDHALSPGQRYGYDIVEGEQSLFAADEALLYRDHSAPSLGWQSQLGSVWHGSCRKPHCDGADALVRADQEWASRLQTGAAAPDVLLMTGDQIYADDVAGPFLYAIHQLIERLGLHDENWQGADVSNLKDLLQHDECYYQRPKLLPDDSAGRDLSDVFFQGARKPIFTSVGADNHLIALAEIVAMYLLVWSDVPWQLVDIDTPPSVLTDLQRLRYDKELSVVKAFAQGLSSVRRVMAHVPSYMIFDDHDVTDDWNLTRGWEEAAYGNPFSRRIIGNALVGYWLFQGWGNQPDTFGETLELAQQALTQRGPYQQAELIEHLVDYDGWHFVLETQPPIMMLDTRTHRWRSESSSGKPSGLMDWERLSELQHQLIDHQQVLLVSPAPIFGVKLIEVVQRVFTFFGHPLMVDAENWMAHPGAANVLLNIFRHRKTPPQFIVLSGDVHYSFTYDVELKRRQDGPKILQITASGLKNTFPAQLLHWFDRCNRWLYASRSPLNWFTKRRSMRIRQRFPQPNPERRTLLNGCGLGELVLADEIDDMTVKVLLADGTDVHFPPRGEKEYR
ncbi:hypothetical protein CHH28_02010 [Bacterioplanes sanyensis]|uniref:PhoD-like phosphatase metallophosphatase domain-containing protein n=1 Tax=Bacterioplanes sanyensis TaxID=1249553 RepID=A0A222FGH0_9GAMM|nr:alkaline phosphatase D family protein [Bacterioplanes sanyensis]ASP37521.1 hypothetical protein CHH28_02010 [Bacterioplanes sanyensis]